MGELATTSILRSLSLDLKSGYVLCGRFKGQSQLFVKNKRRDVKAETWEGLPTQMDVFLKDTKVLASVKEEAQLKCNP